jgi:alkylhydroperoxidase family enzyme
VPEELTRYVDKVAKHAYKVTDADVEALHLAGYSEDAIFEITLSAALGAGLARLERGLEALR